MVRAYDFIFGVSDTYGLADKIENLINAEYDDWTLINPFKSKDFSNI